MTTINSLYSNGFQKIKIKMLTESLKFHICSLLLLLMVLLLSLLLLVLLLLIN